MPQIDVVNDAGETLPGHGEASTATVDAAPARGEDVDPVPIGDPDQDDGDDEDDDEEEEEEDEEPLQCAGCDTSRAGVQRIREDASTWPGVPS